MSVAHVCVGVDCGKPAKMQCPTCKKKRLPPAYFCGQECFKANWDLHKAIHKALKFAKSGAFGEANPKNSDLEILPAFSWTGDLRPWTVTERREVPDDIPKPDYAESGVPVSELKLLGSTRIKVLSDDEILKMRKSCKLARDVLDLAGAAIKEGVTADEVDAIAHEAIVKAGAYPSPLNYRGFPKSCCISVNEIICHGIPDTRPFANGDIVKLDVSVFLDGYHGDVCEVFTVGDVDDKGRLLVKGAYDSLMNAIACVKPGVLVRDIGPVIQSTASELKLSVVRSFVGHGVHTMLHTTPNVPHYARNKGVGVLKAGMTFTIEPMINEGSYREVMWPDEWAAATIDGKRSAQFEHTLLVTEDGCEILTAKTENSQSEPSL